MTFAQAAVPYASSAFASPKLIAVVPLIKAEVWPLLSKAEFCLESAVRWSFLNWKSPFWWDLESYYCNKAIEAKTRNLGSLQG